MIKIPLNNQGKRTRNDNLNAFAIHIKYTIFTDSNPHKDGFCYWQRRVGMRFPRGESHAICENVLVCVNLFVGRIKNPSHS